MNKVQTNNILSRILDLASECSIEEINLLLIQLMPLKQKKLQEESKGLYTIPFILRFLFEHNLIRVETSLTRRNIGWKNEYKAKASKVIIIMNNYVTQARTYLPSEIQEVIRRKYLYKLTADNIVSIIGAFNKVSEKYPVSKAKLSIHIKLPIRLYPDVDLERVVNEYKESC